MTPMELTSEIQLRTYEKVKVYEEEFPRGPYTWEQLNVIYTQAATVEVLAEFFTSVGYTLPEHPVNAQTGVREYIADYQSPMAAS